MKILRCIKLIAFTSLIIYGCSNEVDNPSFQYSPVVEGYLYAGLPLEVKISQQVPYSSDLDTLLYNMDTLSVRIFYKNLYHNLLPIGDGKYINSNININQSDSFRLEFYYNNLSISAKTTIPEKPKNFQSSSYTIHVSDNIFDENNPSELKFSWDNPDGSFYFLLIENIEPKPTPIFDNSNVSTISQSFNLTPTQSGNYSMNTRRFLYYGNHRIILFHIRSDLAILYEENDNTSQTISNPYSEIENAFGIFTGINSDTIYLNVGSQ